MATTRQVQAAKRNVKRAQEGARRKRTIANLPESTRRDLGKQGAKAARRGGEAGHALEDRTRGRTSVAACRRAGEGVRLEGRRCQRHADRAACDARCRRLRADAVSRGG